MDVEQDQGTVPSGIDAASPADLMPRYRAMSNDAITATATPHVGNSREIGALQPVRSGVAAPLTVGFDTDLASEARVQEAISEGYRLFQMDAHSGNAAEVGKAIAAAIWREDVFLSTKIGIAEMGFDKTVNAVRSLSQQLASADAGWASRAKSRLAKLAGFRKGKPAEGALDLVMLHLPGNLVELDLSDHDKKYLTLESWKALEMLKVAKEVNQIGVSNFGKEHLSDLLPYVNIPPSVNQIEIHPYNQRTELVDFCKSEGIAVQAYSSLGERAEGRQGMQGMIPGGVHETPVTDDLLKEPTLMRIAGTHEKTIPQVILRWHLQRGITPIPKASGHMSEFYGVVDFELSDADMKDIATLEQGRFVGVVVD
jgi:diketogulonate reductase-like aldo/keto reductase